MPEDVRVPRRTQKEIDEVDGNLSVDEGVVRSSKPGGSIRVSGYTDCRDDCTFETSLATSEFRGRDGDILVEGNLSVQDSIKIKRGRLEVSGDLTSKKMEVDRSVSIGGDMEVERARVGGTLRVRGKSKATHVDVGGSFKTESDAEVEEIDVGGSVQIDGATKSGIIKSGGSFKGYGPVDAELIDVGGTVRIDGEAKLEEVDVGGSVKLTGGLARDIRVGGTLKSSDPLDFERIRVGGSVKISGGKGGNIDVGGTFKSDGDLTFENIDVGGTVKIDGNAYGRNIEVGGTAKVDGDMELTEDLRVGGNAEAGGLIKARAVLVGGKVEARRVEALDEIRTNTLRTKDGAKADYIELGRRGEVEGPLVARKVLIRERARVEDIHAEEVTLRRGCRALNIYADRVTVETDCRISGEVRYTDSMRAERDVRFAYEPEKTEKLPEPPL